MLDYQSFIGASDLTSDDRVHYGRVLEYNSDDNYVVTSLENIDINSLDLKGRKSQGFYFTAMSTTVSGLWTSYLNHIVGFEVDCIKQEARFYFNREFERKTIKGGFILDSTKPEIKKEPENQIPNSFSNFLYRLKQWF